jgi:hypothetical protein
MASTAITPPSAHCRLSLVWEAALEGEAAFPVVVAEAVVPVVVAEVVVPVVVAEAVVPVVVATAVTSVEVAEAVTTTGWYIVVTMAPLNLVLLTVVKPSVEMDPVQSAAVVGVTRQLRAMILFGEGYPLFVQQVFQSKK